MPVETALPPQRAPRRRRVAAATVLVAAGLACLLAPAAASMDCFRDYAERGALFAAAATGGAA